MERKTPLYDIHVAEGGKIVPFAGYLLPVQYGSGVIKEHMAVRQQAGLFDVSHMGEILFTGPTALASLNHLLTNDYSDMPVNKVRYGVMCNPQGGTIDDLVVYKFEMHLVRGRGLPGCGQRLQPGEGLRPHGRQRLGWDQV